MAFDASLATESSRSPNNVRRAAFSAGMRLWAGGVCCGGHGGCGRLLLSPGAYKKPATSTRWGRATLASPRYHPNCGGPTVWRIYASSQRARAPASAGTECISSSRAATSIGPARHQEHAFDAPPRDNGGRPAGATDHAPGSVVDAPGVAAFAPRRDPADSTRRIRGRLPRRARCRDHTLPGSLPSARRVLVPRDKPVCDMSTIPARRARCQACCPDARRMTGQP